MLPNSECQVPLCVRVLVALTHIFALAGCELVTAGTNLLAQAGSPVVNAPIGDGDKVPDIEMQFHGNWCGPNYPSEATKASGKDLTPVDRLDVACMKHDLCYAANGGKPSCRCNEEMIWRIKYLQYHVDDLPANTRSKAFLMLAWLESARCSPEAPDDGEATINVRRTAEADP